jgi:hypothetical protein
MEQISCAVVNTVIKKNIGVKFQPEGQLTKQIIFIYKKGTNSNHNADLEAFGNSDHSASRRWSAIKYMLTNNQMIHYRNIHDIAIDKKNIGAKNNIY